jgi:hypothetical protein
VSATLALRMPVRAARRVPQLIRVGADHPGHVLPLARRATAWHWCTIAGVARSHLRRTRLEKAWRGAKRHAIIMIESSVDAILQPVLTTCLFRQAELKSISDMIYETCP